LIGIKEDTLSSSLIFTTSQFTMDQDNNTAPNSRGFLNANIPSPVSITMAISASKLNFGVGDEIKYSLDEKDHAFRKFWKEFYEHEKVNFAARAYVSAGLYNVGLKTKVCGDSGLTRVKDDYQKLNVKPFYPGSPGVNAHSQLYSSLP
jgi:hypothetical protein